MYHMAFIWTDAQRLVLRPWNGYVSLRGSGGGVVMRTGTQQQHGFHLLFFFSHHLSCLVSDVTSCHFYNEVMADSAQFLEQRFL